MMNARPFRGLLLLWAALWGLALPAHTETPRVPRAGALAEPDLKALYLINFARLTTWPGEENKTNAFVLGYLRADPVKAHLEKWAGQSIQGRTVRLVRCLAPADAEACHLVYLNTADSEVVEDFLETLEGQPILTVAEIKGAARRGAMIGFFLVGEKLRFEINLSRARAARLSMSSHLLGLGRLVDGMTPRHDEVDNPGSAPEEDRDD